MANGIEHSVDGGVADVGEPTQLAPPTENGHAAGHNGTSGDGFERDLLVALLRFKDGDFSSRMPADLVGVEGKIADVFNEILAVSARRAAETARVCRVVGKEGKLKERMRVPGRGRRLGRRDQRAQHADRRPGVADHRGDARRRRGRQGRSQRRRWRSRSTAGRSRASSCARRSSSTR